MWMPCLQRLIHLVGGFNPSEKYEFVNGKDDIPYMKWKIFQMFETTNQIGFFLKLEVATPVSSKTNNMAEHRAASTPYL